jgi:hypothetical protein
MDSSTPLRTWRDVGGDAAGDAAVFGFVAQIAVKMVAFFIFIMVLFITTLVFLFSWRSITIFLRGWVKFPTGGDFGVRSFGAESVRDPCRERNVLAGGPGANPGPTV